MLSRIVKLTCIACALSLLAACQQPAPPPGIKLGKPYNIEGKMYHPAYDPTYDKVGEASWYGPGFHGKYTASGEVFDQDDLTAAHPTLPMPSIVRVTNLSNGRSKIVRINDRGPFKHNRIIDLSRKSARELGIKGVSQVRVQFLKLETEEYITVVKTTGKGIDMAKFNNEAARTEPATLEASAQPVPASPQIIEQTDASSHSGQPINDAAPIVTVSSENLAPEKPATNSNYGGVTNLYDSSGKPIRSRSVISSAWADEGSEQPISEPIEAKNVEPAKTAEPFNPPPAQFADNKPTPEITVEKTVEKTEEKADAAPAAGGKYIIQAGSFSSEANAQKLHSKMLDIATASIDYSEKGGKSWWRVRVGPFNDKDEAQLVLDQVRASGVPDARLVSN